MSMNNIIETLLELPNIPNVNKVFHVGLCFQSDELIDMLEEMDDQDWYSMFPFLKEYQCFPEYVGTKDCVDLLIEINKLGFICEVFLPRCDHFSLHKNGEVSGYSLGASSAIKYIYAESIEDVMALIEQSSNETFNYDLNAWIKRHSTQKGGEK